MRLPKIGGGGGVQSLGRVSPTQKAAAASAPYTAATSILEDTAKMAVFGYLIEGKEEDEWCIKED